MYKYRLAIVIVGCLAVFAGAGGAVRAGELDAVFAQILRSPGNVSLNLRYAKMAEAAGRRRHALGAYERVLAADPSNSEAKAGLARLRGVFQPAITRITASVGADYETNPRNLPKRIGKRNDAALNGSLKVVDQRVLSGTAWRSLIDGYGEIHTDIRDLDYGTVQAYSGPVFDLPGSARVHIAPGVATAMLDGRFFYVEPGVSVGLERLWPGILDAITFKAGYRDVAKRFGSRDGVLLDLSLRTSLRGLLTPRDALHVMPRVRYREPAGSSNPGGGAPGAPGAILPGNYVGVGGGLTYYLPVAQDVTWGLNLTVAYRDYAHDIRFGTKGRRDWYVAPGTDLLFRNVLCTRCDLKVHYRFEDNGSNDPSERYETHNAGLRAIRRF